MATYINSQGLLLVQSGARVGSIVGTAGADNLVGTAGNDFFSYTGGGDILAGGKGDDSYVVSNVKDVIVEKAGEGIDTVTAYIPYYRLTDNVENLVTGGWGEGNASNNLMMGAAGSQTLDGGAGNDVLVGGAGADTFIVRKNNGSDVIFDFETGKGGDMARLDNYGFATFDAIKAAMKQVGSDVVLQLSSSETLTFRNTQVGAFTADNFKMPADVSGMTMTFADEFTSFNWYNPATGQGTWRTDYGYGATTNSLGSRTLTGNAEQQIYADAAFTGSGTKSIGVNPFSINNGALDIHAQSVSDEVSNKIWGYDYTSGLITTKNSFAQQYGYFEINAKIPSGQGLWPAFWLLPADGTWPPEIDIMESIGDASTVYETAHTKQTGTHVSDGTATHVYGSPSDYHTYGLSWTSQYLVWYVDGAEVKRIATPADMNKPMYILANLAVGGRWPGNPDPSLKLDATMSIDYIHVYQYADSVVQIGAQPVAAGAAKDSLSNTTAAAPLPPTARVVTGTSGNDTFTIQATTDQIIEQANGGTDIVKSAFTWSLGANLENLILTGVSDLDGFGNELANRMVGNDGSNRLEGRDGADYLDGARGDDVLVGGAGDDLYVVDSVGDKVIELAGEGYDTVWSSVSWTLGANVENLSLTGSNAVYGIGNELNNRIIGNTASNRIEGGAGSDSIDGGAGDDVLMGGAGDDVLIVDSVRDQVIEYANEGMDTVQSSVTWTLGANLESLTLTGAMAINGTGNQLANRLIGNAANNRLEGLAGADNLDGGAGNDTLVGGADADYLKGGLGADTFIFARGSGADTVLDFSASQGDVLDFSAYHNTAHTVSVVRGSVVIDFGAGDSVTLLGVSTIDAALNSHIHW